MNRDSILFIYWIYLHLVAAEGRADVWKPKFQTTVWDASRTLRNAAEQDSHGGMERLDDLGEI